MSELVARHYFASGISLNHFAYVFRLFGLPTKPVADLAIMYVLGLSMNISLTRLQTNHP